MIVSVNDRFPVNLPGSCHQLKQEFHANSQGKQFDRLFGCVHMLSSGQANGKHRPSFVDELACIRG